jgi:hypothetical protein
MPQYTNTNDYIVSITQSPFNLNIPASEAIDTNFYIRNLPSGVTLTAHTPLITPWVLLSTVSSFPSSDITVASYKSIIIFNASDNIVTIAANGSDANAVVLMASSKEVWNNSNGVFGILTVLTNTGSGNVYVWGAR